MRTTGFTGFGFRCESLSTNTQQLLFNMQMHNWIKCYLHTNVTECISSTALARTFEEIEFQTLKNT